MSNILEAIMMTAMVLGFVVLGLMLWALLWFISARLEAWRYNRRRKRQHDLEWDNLRSAWIFDLRQNRTDTEESEVVYYETIARVKTDVLDEITPEAIINYRKEQSDAPHPYQGG